MNIEFLAELTLLALLLIQIFHAYGYVVVLAQRSRCSFANASHLPESKYAAMVFLTGLSLVEFSVHSDFFWCMSYLCES